jgi:hypothetical protein
VPDPKNQTVILFAGEASERQAGARTPVLVVVQGDEIGRRYLLNEPELTKRMPHPNASPSSTSAAATEPS